MPSRAFQTLELQTPEGVTFSIPLAGPITRFLAWAIDAAVVFLVFSIISSLVGVTGFLGQFMLELGSAMLTVAYFFFNYAYSILFEWFWRGQTIGKFLLGLRVMDIGGLRLTFPQVVVRNLLRAVDALPLGYCVGGIAMLLSPHAQRLGDIAANTIVVRARRMEMPNFKSVLPDKYNSFRQFPHIEARLRQRVSPEEAILAVNALLRRNELEDEARLRLYAQLAAHFKTKAEFPHEALIGLSDEQYLRNVVESLFRQNAA